MNKTSNDPPHPHTVETFVIHWSTDNLGKHFGIRSGRTKRWAWSDSKHPFRSAAHLTFVLLSPGLSLRSRSAGFWGRDLIRIQFSTLFENASFITGMLQVSRENVEGCSTVKPVITIDKSTGVLMANGSLMKVKSIAEFCNTAKLGAFCNTLDLH